MASGSLKDYGVKTGQKSDNKPEAIADLFGLSSSRLKQAEAANKDSYSYIPPNVRQQIELWERELKSLKSSPGLMIEFDNQEQHTRFMDYAKLNKIQILKSKDKKLIVVDIKHEQQAYDFIFSANWNFRILLLNEWEY